MRDDEKIDGRDMRDGGWYWVQQELLTVFVPLIGRDAAWLYQVLCNLIPETIEKPHIELSIRAIAKAGGYGKSVGAVHRNLRVLLAIGMIEEEKRGRGTPSILKLGSLRKLAGLGNEELKRRLSVPGGNTDAQVPDSVPPAEDAADDAQSRADGLDAEKGEADPDSAEPDAPASPGIQTVPPGNTKANPADGGKNPVEMSLAEFVVFQKGGGSVPEKGGVCSSEDGPFKVLNLSILKTYPLSQAKGGVLPFVTANADSKTGKGKNRKPSRDGPSAGEADDPAMDTAVTWLKRECVLAGRETEAAIRRAMRLEAGKTDVAPDYDRIAAHMAKSYANFLANTHAMAYKLGASRFFDDGLWRDSRKWPWDEKRLREGRRL
jgi:hypothetical protein